MFVRVISDTFWFWRGRAMPSLALKVPPLLLAVLFAAGMAGLSAWLPRVEIALPIKIALIGVIALSGVLFALAGVIAFRRHKTTVDPRFPEQASALVDSGIYQFTRNPMYVGFALWLCAWVVYLQSPWLVLGVGGFVLYMNRFQIEPEEQILLTLFGLSYEHYKQRVRRWL